MEFSLDNSSKAWATSLKIFSEISNILVFYELETLLFSKLFQLLMSRVSLKHREVNIKGFTFNYESVRVTKQKFQRLFLRI